MTPHYTDPWLTVYAGDCRDVLPTLPADSVDCVVTSPPYWGLRDYGTATWVGGDEGCDHRNGRFERPGLSSKQASNNGSGGDEAARICPKCGATRQDAQLGLEPTPEEYVANLVAVFREVRRVLKPSGTCWLNLGDSYANLNHAPGSTQDSSRVGGNGRERWGDIKLNSGKIPSGLKPKDLVGIPWRVAFALQADGWYLRSDIIWSKPNPMPESVTDRPTKAHEYLFLLTKAARYYFDADAVRELDGGKPSGNGYVRPERLSGGLAGGNPEPWQPGAGRNLRSVWTIATRPYADAHFAVFPPELPERCIKAGSPDNGLVLDCFAGSGTVGLVANRLSRKAILIDLNPDYLRQQMRRNAQTPLGLSS